MTLLEKIRKAGAVFAFQNGILGNPKVDEIMPQNELVDEYIDKIIQELIAVSPPTNDEDWNEVNFHRAFVYCFGKGAEFSYFKRIGNRIDEIPLDMKALMNLEFAQKLPPKIKYDLNEYRTSISEMYSEMFFQIKLEKSESETLEFDFASCLKTILTGAFFCGQELCLSFELSELN